MQTLDPLYRMLTQYRCQKPVPFGKNIWFDLNLFKVPVDCKGTFDVSLSKIFPEQSASFFPLMNSISTIFSVSNRKNCLHHIIRHNNMTKGKILLYYSTAAVSTSSIMRGVFGLVPTNTFPSSSGFNEKYIVSNAPEKLSIFQTRSFILNSNSILNSRVEHPPLFSSNRSVKPFVQSSRLFFSRNNKNNDDDGILKKIAKSILPKNLFQSEQEKQRAIEKKRARDEISGGLDSLLRDAPFPIRMMGKMITPMLSSLASQMEEQSLAVEDVLETCRTRIMNSQEIQRELGEPLYVNSPFRQSSSSMNINGQQKSMIQASFQVMGSSGRSAVADLVAENGMIQSLRINIGSDGFQGRVIDLSNASANPNLSGRTAWSNSNSRSNLGRNSNMRNDDIIDAEFVEKK